ncbi:hypothetical protein [Fervidibacillus albus]|uniref:Uncharacterized protein n=1 Tax=Fervidibacillus albus TaxID=2980026 RepID=A0A9E8RW74_9BACI|nr:hypothetical protein [Fervidibacillus albus]WAA10321.1 hypothetical protein OE104_03020 [Fervidibacillus albus]
MHKKAVFDRELEKLAEIFSTVDESKRKLVEGLIEDAAFLKAENFVLRKTLAETGMVKVHPENSSLQKPVEAAKQYLKNVNSYAVIIKTLNGILNKNMLDDDDDLSEFE